MLRRSFLVGALAAPALIAAPNLMKLPRRGWINPIVPPAAFTRLPDGSWEVRIFHKVSAAGPSVVVPEFSDPFRKHIWESVRARVETEEFPRRTFNPGDTVTSVMRLTIA